MSERLAGKRVLITQAGDFMGPAFAEAFRAAGAEVLEDETDLTESGAADAVVESAGHIDVLVANLAAPADADYATRVSDERWEFHEEADGTVVIYAFRMKPKFFIPPLIGPAILKSKLKNGGINAIDRIEAIAREYEPDGD